MVFIIWIYHFIVASLLLIAVNQRLANVSNCIDGYARHKKALYRSNASQLRQKLNKSNKIAHLISRWAILL